VGLLPFFEMGNCLNREEAKKETGLTKADETKATKSLEIDPKTVSNLVAEETKPDPDMAEKAAESPVDAGREDEVEVIATPAPAPEKASVAEPIAAEAFAVGDAVVVVSSFVANSKHSHELEPGMRGKVEEVDEEGDALVDFEDSDELLWLHPKDLVHLTKVVNNEEETKPDSKTKEEVADAPVEAVHEDKAFAVGDDVVVISSFVANSEHSHELKPGMKGKVEEVDDEGDALLDFEDSDELLWLYPADLVHLKKVP